MLYLLQVIKELEFEGAVDIKSSPHSCHMLACVLEKDLWLMNTDNGEKTRLTFSHTPETDLLSAGQPSFISQVSVCVILKGLHSSVVTIVATKAATFQQSGHTV